MNTPEWVGGWKCVMTFVKRRIYVVKDNFKRYDLFLLTIVAHEMRNEYLMTRAAFTSELLYYYN